MTVTVRELDLASFDGETAVLRMRVTAGFYVRSLAHDLGAALGMGAVLVGLRRTRSGEFGLDGAVPLADVLQAGREALAARLLPFSGLLPDLPAVTLRGPEQLARVKNGVEIAPGDLLAPLSPVPELVRLMGSRRDPGGAGQTRQNARVSARFDRVLRAWGWAWGLDRKLRPPKP